MFKTTGHGVRCAKDPMDYSTAESRYDATHLAAHLKSPHREIPVVVISSTKSGPRIDPSAVAVKLAGAAEVFLLGSGAIADIFEDIMPDDTCVYGGAARSYPPGTAWTERSSLAMVRLAYSDEEARRAVDLICTDISRMDPPATSYTSAPAKVEAPSKAMVTGTVSMLMNPDGAIVKVEGAGSGRITRIDTASFAPGIDSERILRTGMKVTGTLSAGVLDITSMLTTTANAADYAEEATIQPVLVKDDKTVILFPGLEIRHRTEGIPAGTVIAVEVMLSGRADGKSWRLSTVENIDPEEVSEALPVLRCGAPWISLAAASAAPEPETPAVPEVTAVPKEATPEVIDPFVAWETVRKSLQDLSEANRALAEENDQLRSTPAPLAEPAAPVPTPMSGGAELERLNREVARLERARRDALEDTRRANTDADTVAAENATLNQLVARLREDVRTERARATRARQVSRESPDAAPADLFNDPVEQFRFDVYQEWATRIPASSKDDLPLGGYDLGPEFLNSVQALHGVDRSKIIAVAVEVLTGLADKLPGREMHPLRGGSNGVPGGITDAELGKAWRVSLQVGTASARRLHFWRGAGGHVTFANVGVHDEISI